MERYVLITGVNGFLGNSILRHVELEGYHVKSLGRNSNNDYQIDLQKCESFRFNQKFEFVVHCAGIAHFVPKTKEEGELFFEINVNGTKKLLEALAREPFLPKSFIFISSVSVYGCSSGTLIKEDFPLNAQDPYGQSKIQAEKLVSEWCLVNDVRCSILRLPLIAGKNAPGNLASMISGIKNGYYFNIDLGKARKSMVLADDVSKYITKISSSSGIYNLTDGVHPTFYELSASIARQLNKSNPPNMPLWMAKIIAKIGDYIGKKAPINSVKLMKIVSELTFDDSKAKKVLNWTPSAVLNEKII